MDEGRWTKAGAAFNGVIALTNIAVALIIFGQLLVLRSQLNEMQGSSKQMDDAIAAANSSAKAAQISAHEASVANQIQLRPWIKLAPKSTRNLTCDDTSKWLMVVEYENVGKAPALNVRTYGGLEVHEYPMGPNTVPANLNSANFSANGDRSRLTILPGDPSATKFKIDKTFNLNSIKDGKARLYAVGTIVYTDAAGNDHHTEYCSAHSYEAIVAARQGGELNGDNCERFQFAG